MRGAQAGSFNSVALQEELDNLEMPLHVRHSLQLALGSDASMAKHSNAVGLKWPLVKFPPESAGDEAKSASNERPEKRQRLSERHLLMHHLGGRVQLIAKQLGAL